MRFSPERRIYLDSPDLTMAENNTVEHDAALSAPEGTEKPQNEFAAELERRMNLKGLNVEQMVGRINARGVVRVDNRRIINLRYRGPASPSSARNKGELAEIAAVLECEIIDLFPSLKRKLTEHMSQAPEDQSSVLHDELLNMIEEGLIGPKANFLRDAIEMASLATRASQRNY